MTQAASSKEKSPARRIGKMLMWITISAVSVPLAAIALLLVFAAGKALFGGA